ncbi:formate/nitrite transporter family protein [Ruminococcus sp.]|uniref:formate/nitrite transporter family protein n=1 Tax=Ruminococcus sp. TaxID=41978 RepID=UPI003FD75B89
MKKITDIFLRALLTGVAIAIGGTVYLSCPNKYLGAFLFGTGLFVILTFGFNLFTGKVGYAVENKPSYLGELGIIWLGNFVGAALSALLITQTRISAISDKAAEHCKIKLGDSITGIFILAFFCGILMFIAADGYKNIQNPVGQILAIFLPVVVFILSGFEHCIANMYYFTLAGSWSTKAFGYLIIMSLGNAAGGILIPLVRKGFVKRT